MNINSINSQSINQMQGEQNTEQGKNNNKTGVLEVGGKSNEHKVNISQVGQVGSYIANLPEAQQQEIKGYIQSVQAAKEDGTFDIASSLNEAPAAFNELTNKLNLNHEDTLNLMSEQKPKGIASSSVEGGKQPELSAYTDVAAQTENNDSNSIFGMFTSLFSSDSEV